MEPTEGPKIYHNARAVLGYMRLTRRTAEEEERARAEKEEEERREKGRKRFRQWAESVVREGSKMEGPGVAQGREGRERRRATEGRDYRQTRRYEKGGGVEAKGKKRRVNTQQAARIGMELYEWLVARGRERWNKKGEG